MQRARYGAADYLADTVGPGQSPPNTHDLAVLDTPVTGNTIIDASYSIGARYERPGTARDNSNPA